MNRESIVERVRKMVALARDNAASPGEIENAMKLARELMTKYGIEDGEVEPAQQQATINRADSASRAGWARWEQSLINVVTNVCDVKAVLNHSGRKVTIQFVGFPADVAVACALYPALLASIRVCARMQFGQGWNFHHRSFAEGFIAGLSKQARQAKQAAQQANAIILRKDLAIQKWMDDNLKLRPGRSSASHGSFDLDAYAEGKRQGERVALKNTMGVAQREALA